MNKGVGSKIGRLTLLKKVYKEENNQKRLYWKCQCECGNTKVIRSDAIGKKTFSCGCLGKERLNEQHSKKRGKYKDNDSKSYSVYHKLYKTWCHIKSRCYNKNDNSYKLYGGRGIKMCDEWLDSYSSFKAWAMNNGFDTNAKGHELSIDRINVDSDYCPENCRWVDPKTQANNTRSNFYIIINGEKKTITEWGRKYNLDPSTIRRRYKKYGMRGTDLLKPLDKKMVIPNIIFVEYNGEKKTLEELSKLTGIKKDTLYRRYTNGMRGAELIKEVKKTRDGRVPIRMEYNGKMYTIGELHKQFGFSETTLRRWYNKGFSDVSEAIKEIGRFENY